MMLLSMKFWYMDRCELIAIPIVCDQCGGMCELVLVCIYMALLQTHPTWKYVFAVRV